MNDFKLIDWNNSLTYIKLFLPFVSSFCISLIPIFRTNKNSGINVKFRPPGFVFGIVWTILYILFGFAWILNKNNTMINIFYSLNLFLLLLWIVIYNGLKYKTGGVFIITLTIINTLNLIIISNNTSKLFLTPLFGWLLLALLLNSFEVQFLDKNYNNEQYFPIAEDINEILKDEK